MSYPFIVQGTNVTVVIDGKPRTVAKAHPTYQKVVDAIKAGEWDKVKQIIDPVKVVLNYGKGNVSIQGDKLFWKGEPFAGVLATRMISMLEEGFTIEPMVNFMENLMTNPSKRAVTELYGFLEKNNLPLTPDGHFLAYKKVRNDFKDIHSGTMLNAPGCVVEMERNQVDDNKDVTCSTGLHFCGLSYLPHFGGGDSRIVIVKINPRDVVSIPSDYNGAKGRACRYEVIGEMGVKAEDAFDKPVQSNANGAIPREPISALKPETIGAISAPREGDSAFKEGYSAGFNGADYRNGYHGKDYRNYDNGYDLGAQDADDGEPERWRYVPKVTFNPAPKASDWPFPSGNK